jgi:hypothetical protein
MLLCRSFHFNMVVKEMENSIFLSIAINGLIEQLFTRKCPTDFLNHLAWLDKYRIESQVTDVPIAIVLHMTRLAKRGVEMAPGFWRSSPDPGFGPVIELRRRHLHGLLDLISIGEALPGEGITTEETPPTFLEIKPAGPFGNEDLLDAWMVCQPDTCFQAIMTAQIIRDNEEIPFGIVSLDVLEKFNVILRIA